MCTPTHALRTPQKCGGVYYQQLSHWGGCRPKASEPAASGNNENLLHYFCFTSKGSSVSGWRFEFRFTETTSADTVGTSDSSSDFFRYASQVTFWGEKLIFFKSNNKNAHASAKETRSDNLKQKEEYLPLELA